MPHYDYICSDCGYIEEIFQKITDSPLNLCPKCQSSTFHRKPGRGGALIYRCTGFYETDYNSPKSSDAASSKPASDSSSGSCCPCGKPSSCS
ncbi:MAG: FmdB family zinc ribbon protein [Chlamydiales bacterium]